ncbi:recombinase family protein, partial [Escherichia coli]|uniref:recombinase family protein n=1 Tax=Escherichia coli TaxID=562 RepID=UPI0032E8C356
VPAYGPQNDVTLKMPAFEWVHVQLHQQKGMISLSPPTICNSAVWKLDRLGRSMRHLVILVEELRERGVNFRSLTDAIDTSTPMGRFFFHVMGALAEMERELIVERTRAGLEAARAKGRIGGRRPKLTASEWEQVGRLLAAGESRQRVALIFDIGLSTLYKKFPASVTKNKLCHPLANRDK